MNKERFSSAVHKTEYIDPDEEADRQMLEELASPSLEPEEMNLDNLVKKYAIDGEPNEDEGGAEEDIDLSEYDKRMRVIGVFKDDNFPGSTIVKTRDIRGFVTGFAIRRNSEGDLEGNRIHYLESGDVGAVFKLHEHDFLALEEKGFLDMVEKLDSPESKEINITNVFRDSNFPGSIVVKTEKDGRNLGFAIRRNSEGDLEGNRIHYLESGDVGAVFKLHEHDFLDPEMTEVLNAVRNFEDTVEVEFPEKEAASFPFHHKTSTLPRTFENPELLNTREASKEFLSAERSELAKEIWEARKRQRERLTYLKLEGEILNNDPEELPISVEDSNLISLAERQSDEANALRERLESSELDEEGAELEKENLKLLISSSNELESLKNKLKEHYEKADDLAKEHFESIQRSVEQTILRNNVFFVHIVLPEGDGSRHNENSNVNSRSNFEDDVDILLSLEPSIATSSVSPGSSHGVWGNRTSPKGALISSGDIVEAKPSDAGTIAHGIKKRGSPGKKEKTSVKEIDDVVSNRRSSSSYNELVIDNPKIFGFFRMAEENDVGQPIAFTVYPHTTPERREEMRNDIIEDLMLANKEGTLPLIMTQDRRFFEFIDINSEDGTIVTGMEITPEMVARGNAGLSDEARLKIGERLLEKKVFKTLRTQIEAREILAEISGEKIDQDFIEREKIDQALKNKDFSELPEKFLTNKDFMMENMHIDPRSAFIYSGDNLKDDKEFVKEVITNLNEQKDDYFPDYNLLSENLKKDKEIISLFVERDEGLYAMDYRLTEDPETWNTIMDSLIKGKSKFWEDKIGSVRFDNYRLKMKDGNTPDEYSLSNKLLNDENFFKKLQEYGPDYKFELDNVHDENFLIKVTKVR